MRIGILRHAAEPAALAELAEASEQSGFDLITVADSSFVYEGENGFDALEWLAAMISHVPGQGRTDSKVDFDLRNVGYLLSATYGNKETRRVVVKPAAGISCEIVPQSFHKLIRETDFVTPISLTVQTIWEKIQNSLANCAHF